MKPCERVQAALNYVQPDSTPCDDYAFDAPSHHIQPDTAVEDVLAVYRTVARRRGRAGL